MIFLKIAVAVLSVWGACSEARRISSRSDAMAFLKRYGHLDKNANMEHLTVKEQRDAIMSFQKMNGAKPSGFLDSGTRKIMEMPRCGMPDISTESENSVNPRWSKRNLTYSITKYPASTLTRREVDEEIRRAFLVWSGATDLTFRKHDSRRDRKADIDIRFEIGSHGDFGEANNFDGPDGTLAHAYSPTDGRAHFDDTEQWTVRSDKGINLFKVAAHEFGHNLGLHHSDVYYALMYAAYTGYEPNFELDDDDIEQIQALYGPKTQARSSTIPSTPRRAQDTCEYPDFDTIFTDLEGRTYVLNGSQYWKPGKVGVPRLFKTKWSGLPPRVDAVFSVRDLDKTYFFSGAYVWRYQGDSLDPGYPKRISKRFPGIPDNLDAAFVWPFNNQIYFFKGREFWKFDRTRWPQVSPVYPRDINVWWRGVPDAPDAAFVLEGKTYFVKDGVYSLFDDREIAVASRGAIGRLFGCQNDLVTTRKNRSLVMPIRKSAPKASKTTAKSKKCSRRMRCWRP